MADALSSEDVQQSPVSPKSTVLSSVYDESRDLTPPPRIPTNLTSNADSKEYVHGDGADRADGVESVDGAMVTAPQWMTGVVEENSDTNSENENDEMEFGVDLEGGDTFALPVSPGNDVNADTMGEDELEIVRPETKSKGGGFVDEDIVLPQTTIGSEISECLDE